MKTAKEKLTDDAGFTVPEFRNYQFRVRGHGHDIYVGEFNAHSEERAFGMAFKACKRFELPGWTLTCVTTNTSLPVVKLIGYKDDGQPLEGPYSGSRGRRTSRRV